MGDKALAGGGVAFGFLLAALQNLQRPPFGVIQPRGDPLVGQRLEANPGQAAIGGAFFGAQPRQFRGRRI